jgi:large subunit ribosomal protein L3
MSTLLGKKVGMTRAFDDAGNIVPVTALEVGPCTVLAVKTVENDGYSAAQIGFLDRKASRATKAETGHAAKAGTTPKTFVREVPLPEGEIEPGQSLTLDLFDEVDHVDVVGTSKGRGFAGMMKRYGASGGPASHGASGIHRRVGSIGMSATPSRVLKGKRMPGHMGHERKTVMNLEVVQVDKENNLLLVKGGVPGPRNGFVIVRKTKK